MITNSNGSNTTFQGSSSAGTAAITTNSSSYTAFFHSSNGGSASLVTNNLGNVYFTDSSSAEGASLTTNPGGTLTFYASSRAGTATLLNDGGIANFYATSTAEDAKFTNTNEGGAAFYGLSTAGAAKITNALTGATVFYETAKAGSAAITNESGGRTFFRAASTAESAKITTNSGGGTVFADDSTAAGATVTTNTGGATAFEGSSKAGSAAIITNAGGTTYFRGTSSAETATLTTNSGGTLVFEAASRAGGATLINDGGVANVYGTGTADGAKITNTNNGGAAFHGTSTAGNAQITNTLGGITAFRESSGAGTAAISNESGSGTLFGGTSTADRATIVTNSGGGTVFRDSSSAGTAGANLTITSGGEARFYNTSTAGQATLTTASGGHTYFFDSSTAGSARLIAAASGEIDFSPTGGPNNDRRIAAGSIEGGGTYYLGSNTLAVGGLDTSTAVSGSIRDGGAARGSGASLVKVGTGTLTLSGTNTYTGGTVLSGGQLVLDGLYAAGTGAITFTTGSQTLRLTAGALGTPGGTYGHTLADLGQGDTLDLRGMAYAGDAVAVYSGGTLTVTSGGAIESFVLTGSYAGLAFRAVNDGSDGVAVQVVDAAPTVVGVTASAADGIYKAGDVISIQVTFSEAVTVTGTPQLTLETGTTDRVLDFAGITGGNVLTFTYTVQPGDAAADLDYRDTAALRFNGGAIRDAAGNDAVLTLATPGQSGSLSDDKALVIDTAAPVVSSVQVPANGTYKFGDTLSFTVTFSETVTLTGGDSTLGLTIGSTGVQATYQSQTATSLTYSYVVQEGQVDTDGVVIGRLDLKTSTLTDTAGNAAAVALDGVGVAGDVRVDAVRPTVTSILRQTPAAEATNADTLVYRVTFSEGVSGVGVTDFAVTGTTATVTGVTSAGVNAYDVTVSGGDLASLNGSVTLSLASPTIHDAAGNALTGTTPTGPGSPTYTLDNTAPTVQVTLSDTALKAGDTATVTFTFSEAPTGFGSADVVLTDANGALGPVTVDPQNAKVYTATFTPAADLEQASNVIAAGIGWSDASGNAPTGTTSSPTYTIDTKAPTVVVVLDRPALSDGTDTGAVSFTFSEAPASFSLADVTVTGGELSNLQAAAQNPLVYSATFTATDDSVSDASIQVKAGMVADGAGNPNAASHIDTAAVDTRNPTVTSVVASDALITDADSGSVTATITFSEAMDPSVAPVVTTNAGTTLTSSSGSWTGATAYAVTYTLVDANASVADVTFTISGARDVAGNAQVEPATLPASPAAAIDTLNPTVTVSMTQSAFSDADRGETVTFTFSEAPGATFGLEDVTVAGGVLTNLLLDPASQGLVYTATLEIPDDADTPASVQVGAGTVADSVGNASTASNQVTATVDTRNPSAAIALSRTSFAPGQSAVVTFTFSEAPAGFTLEDLTAENGTLSGLAATADPRVFTATFTAASAVLDGTNLITLGTAWSDAAGNAPRTGVTSASYSLDTRIAVAPSAPDLVDASDLGTSITDDITSDTTPTFVGSGANAGALVRLYAGAALVGTGTADAAGLWSITTSELAAGAYTVTTRQVDAGGTEGSASAGLSVTIASQVGHVVLEPTTETNPDGQAVEVITIPVVTGEDPTLGTAGVPLVSLAGQVVLSVAVPEGFGLRVENTTGISGMDGLIQAIQSRTEAGSEQQQTFTEAGTAFLANLDAKTTLTVRTIVPTVPSGTTPGEPLVIRGQAGPSGQQEALVIDVSGLPPGTVVELENVEFAVIVGPVNITGGSGRQVLFADGASQRIVLGADDDELHGGGGDDVIGSLEGNDLLFGDAGHDTVTGGDGDDSLWGGLDDDQLWGEAGSDILSGGEGRDRLWGGEADDRLLGEDGHDRLRGGRGDDRLEGGAGRDVLIGGEGADTFVFSRVEDDAAGRLRDVIRDFRSGDDGIGLRGIDADGTEGGNQSFSWVDKDDLEGRFTGEAGQLRFARGLLMGDTDGDGQADFRIKVQGSLAAGDVVL